MAEANPPRFDGTNYSLWAMQMKFYLKGLHLWEHTQGEVAVPELSGNPTIAAIKRHEDVSARTNRAVSTLHTAMSDEILSRLLSCETAKEIWDKLKAEFEGDARSKDLQILNLRAEFEKMEMQDSESIKDYANRFITIVGQMRILGEQVEDKRVVERMLISLPARFDQKINSLEDTKDLKTLSVVEFVNALHMAELRQKRRAGGGNAVAMVAQQAQVAQQYRVVQTQKPVDRFGTEAESSR